MGILQILRMEFRKFRILENLNFHSCIVYILSQRCQKLVGYQAVLMTQRTIEVKREWVKTDFTEAWSYYVIILSIYCYRGIRSLSITRLF